MPCFRLVRNCPKAGLHMHNSGVFLPFSYEENVSLDSPLSHHFSNMTDSGQKWNNIVKFLSMAKRHALINFWFFSIIIFYYFAMCFDNRYAHRPQVMDLNSDAAFSQTWLHENGRRLENNVYLWIFIDPIWPWGHRIMRWTPTFRIK
jgi:hypothetical protein